MKIIYPFVIFLRNSVLADQHAPEIIKTTFPENCDITGQINIPNANAMRQLKCVDHIHLGQCCKFVDKFKALDNLIGYRCMTDYERYQYKFPIDPSDAPYKGYFYYNYDKREYYNWECPVSKPKETLQK